MPGSGQPVVLLEQSRGLNTASDPARLGPEDLAVAVNVDVEADGRISRRRGFSQVRAEACHSLWSHGSECLYVSGDTLYRLLPGYGREALRTGLTEGARMSYVQVAGVTYFANGFERGKVPLGGAAADWIASDYVGPTTMKGVSDPPTGHLLDWYGGRVTEAVDDTLWYSNLFAYSWFDMARNYVSFDSRITMLAAVADGVWVGTAGRIYFLGGADLADADRRTVAYYGAIEGTACIVEGGLLAGLEMTGPVVVWGSPFGICLGGPGGVFLNLTDRRLSYPSAQRGSGIVHNKRYILTLEE